MSPIYATFLILALCCLGLIDHRWRLAVFCNRKASLYTLGLSVIFFLLWDIAGVGLGIFFIGQTTLLSGITIMPQVPIEEILFLFLLCYQSLILHTGLNKLRQHRATL